MVLDSVKSDPGDTLSTGVLIGSEWIHKTSAGDLEHVNPATGRTQRTFPIGGAVEVGAAVEAAREALGPWRSWRPLDRRNVLLKLAALMRERADSFATISTLEAGIIRSRASYLAPRAAEWIEYYAGWIDKLSGSVIPVHGTFDYTLREPIGVVGLVLPASGPTGALGRKVGPALAAGCCVVVKPSELAPFSPSLFGELCLEAGLPPGVVNIVPGGAEAGDALVRHAGLDKVSFTGGTAVGRRIQEACASVLTPVMLELGGKSANIIFDDASPVDAAQHAADNLIAAAGQACVAPTRLLVHESLYDQVVGLVVDRLAAVRLGDPMEMQTTMGPVISSVACERIMGMINRAIGKSSSNLVLGGERASGKLASGFYVPPTVFEEVDSLSELAQNEIFGPVLTVSKFSSDDEAVGIANATPFGLAAYLHTTSLTRALSVAARLESGNIAVNGGAIVVGPSAPFGGFKNSGFGAEGGLAGLLEFVRTKNVNISLPNVRYAI